MPFGGGTGGGISVQPLGFIAATADDVKFVHIDDASPAGNMDAIVDSIVKLCKTFSKKKEDKQEEEVIVTEEVTVTEESQSE